MDEVVLLALISKLVDEKLKSISNSNTRGPRGPKGMDGKDFDFSEHEEQIRAWAKEFSLKFSDLTQEEINKITGPQGSQGLSGTDGKDFNFEEYKSEIENIISGEISSHSDSLKLKFSDLTEEEIEKLKGPQGKEGRKGNSFVFEDNKEKIENIISEEISNQRDFLKLKFSDLTEDEVQSLKGSPGKDGEPGKSFIFEEHEEFFNSLKPKISDLTEEEIELLRGPKGKDGKPGASFIFEEHRSYFDSLKMKFTDLTDEERYALTLKFSDLSEEEVNSLKMKFSDLTDEERISLKGFRGQRGKVGPEGPQGIQGLKGDSGVQGPRGVPGSPGPIGVRGLTGNQGLQGERGEDAPFIEDIDIIQKKNKFKFHFLMSDGTTKETDYVKIPAIDHYFSVSTGGYGVSGGGGTGGGGKTLVAGDNITFTDETPTSVTINATGAGADGKSAYEIAVEEGFVGTEAEWLASLVGPEGPQGEVGPEGPEGPQGPQGEPGDGAPLELLDCETSVFPGAAVRLKKVDEEELNMDEWVDLLSLGTLDATTYDTLVSNAKADTMENSNVFGLVESKPSASTCLVRTGGKSAANYTALDVEEEYYLSADYAGRIVSSKPVIDGQIILKIGQPLNFSQLLYQRGERKIVGA